MQVRAIYDSGWVGKSIHSAGRDREGEGAAESIVVHPPAEAAPPLLYLVENGFMFGVWRGVEIGFKGED